MVMMAYGDDDDNGDGCGSDNALFYHSFYHCCCMHCIDYIRDYTMPNSITRHGYEQFIRMNH
jgi:hypothetical protein